MSYGRHVEIGIAIGLWGLLIFYWSKEAITHFIRCAGRKRREMLRMRKTLELIASDNSHDNVYQLKAIEAFAPETDGKP